MCQCNPNVRTPWCGKPGCTLEDARIAAASSVATEIGKKPTVHSWFGAFELECPCGSFSMQNLRLNAVLACRNCPRVFRIDGFGANEENGSLQVALSMGIREEAPKVAL